jgi:lipid-A-disaccharide synthase
VKVSYASLVNLLNEAPVVPERLQEACTPPALADELVRLLTDPATAAAQGKGFATALAKLRPPRGRPSDAAAEAVLHVLEERGR